MHHTPTLLNQQQLAEDLNVSPRTLEKWRVEGYGPRWVRVGSLCRYRPADVQAWLEAQYTYYTSDPGGGKR